jgi:hypothetical protein
VDGRLAGYVARGERELTPFLPAEDDPLRLSVMSGLAQALAEWGRRTGRVTLGWSPADEPLVRSTLAPVLREAGFVPWGPGFRLDAPSGSGAGFAEPPVADADEMEDEPGA